jgi:serine/threonine protein phosphatase 1
MQRRLTTSVTASRGGRGEPADRSRHQKARIEEKAFSLKGLTSFLGFGKGAERERRARVRLDMADIAIYAIGDVHGCLDELLALERVIVQDAESLPGRKLIVMLGDYVDRGPASAPVLDHLIAPPPRGFERICLCGNHEMVMLDYIEGLAGRAGWIAMGAEPTLLSYGIDPERLRNIYPTDRQVDDAIRAAIPAAHVAFLRSLPIMIETQRFIFVHAGVRPELPLDRQSDEDMVFIRSAFFERAHLLSRYVVHGHTPVEEAAREGMRVNIDTGAFFSGRLTALRIWQNKGRYLTN